MCVDKSRRDQFSRGIDTGVDRAGVGPTRVDDAIILIDDCAVVVDLMILAIERHHPATLN